MPIFYPNNHKTVRDLRFDMLKRELLFNCQIEFQQSNANRSISL
jgi:hypothetical protein